MKKILGLLFICVVLLAGCGAKQKTITWYLMGSEPKDVALVEAEINKELGSLGKDYQVDLVFYDYGVYNDKVKMKIQAGEEMDIYFSPAWALPYAQNSKDGLNVDLTPYMETTLKDTHTEVAPELWDGVSVNGKIYGIPTNKELGQDNYFVFDSALVAKYGIDVNNIKTLDDFFEVLKKAKSFNDGIPPYITDIGWRAAGLLEYDCISGTENQICIDSRDPNGKFDYVYNIPGYKDFMLKINQAIKDGLIATNTLELWDMSKDPFFVVAQAGFPYAEANWEAQWSKELTAVPYDVPTITTETTRGSINSVSITSKHVEESVDFLNLVNTNKNIRNTMAYGIKGNHYNLNDKNEVVYDKEKQKNYAPGIYEQGNFFILDVLEGEPANKWSEFKARNDQAVESPALGFYPDLTKFQAELANFQSMVVNKYMASLALGQTENLDADLAKFKAEADQIGLQAMIDEINNQYEAWKK